MPRIRTITPAALRMAQFSGAVDPGLTPKWPYAGTVHQYAGSAFFWRSPEENIKTNDNTEIDLCIDCYQAPPETQLFASLVGIWPGYTEEALDNRFDDFSKCKGDTCFICKRKLTPEDDIEDEVVDND